MGGHSMGGSLCTWLGSLECFREKVVMLILFAPAFAITPPLVWTFAKAFTRARATVLPGVATRLCRNILQVGAGKKRVTLYSQRTLDDMMAISRVSSVIGSAPRPSRSLQTEVNNWTN